MRTFGMTLGCVACLLAWASPGRAEWLDITPNQPAEYDFTRVDQGWSEQDRARFYSTSGGSILLPCLWFLALEQKDNLDLLVADHNVAQLHLVPTKWVGRPTGAEDGAASGCNGGRLPVGIAVTVIHDPASPYHRLGAKWVGLNCAFCHTGVMHYTKELPATGEGRTSAKRARYTLYVDGGASMQSNYRFLIELFGALRATIADSDKFARFAGRVFGHCVAEAKRNKEPLDSCGAKGANDAAYQEALRSQVADYTHKLLSRARIDIAEWGFGRFDALGRGSNHVFVNLDPDNLRYANAPVSIPPLWYAWRYDVVQWSGLIRHPIARNISQTIAVGAGLFEDKRSAATAFRSTTDVPNIVKLEGLVRKLKPPDWPEPVLGPIQRDLAMQGKQLYADKCARCHLPVPNLHPTKSQAARGQLLSVKVVPRALTEQAAADPAVPDEIGTDRAYLVNAGSRYVSTVSTECNVSNAGAESSAPRLYCDFSKLFGGQTVLPMPKAIELITTRIMEQAKKDQQLRPPYDDLSDNIWSPPLRMQDGQSAPVVGYIARPHAAVWATPPFLHNGSVPTLYDLLSPSFLPEDRLAPPAEWPAQWRDSWKREREYEAAIRPKCFLVGDLEYDPVKVGYQVHPCDPRSRPDNPYSGFNFETSRPGNSNEGHEFSDYDRRTLRKFSEEECRRLAKHSRDGILGCGLAHEERLALIEYLKTCDLDDLFDWQPGGTQKKWDPAAPPVTLCRRPLTVVRQ